VTDRIRHPGAVSEHLAPGGDHRGGGRRRTGVHDRSRGESFERRPRLEGAAEDPAAAILGGGCGHVVRIDGRILRRRADLPGADLHHHDLPVQRALILRLLGDELLQVPLQVTIDGELQSPAVHCRRFPFRAWYDHAVLPPLVGAAAGLRLQAGVCGGLQTLQRSPVRSDETDEVAGDRPVRVGPRRVGGHVQVGQLQVREGSILLGGQSRRERRIAGTGISRERVGDDPFDVCGGLSGDGRDLRGRRRPLDRRLLAVCVDPEERTDVGRVELRVVPQHAAGECLPVAVDDRTPSPVQGRGGADAQRQRVIDVLASVDDLDIDQAHDEGDDHDQHDSQRHHRAATRAAGAVGRHRLSVLRASADPRTAAGVSPDRRMGPARAAARRWSPAAR